MSAKKVLMKSSSSLNDPQSSENTESRDGVTSLTRDVSGKEKTTSRWRKLVNPRWLGVYLLLILVAVFSVLFNRTFFSLGNLQAILSNETIGLILALSLMSALVVGQYDLSFANVMTLSLITVTGLFQGFEVSIGVAVVSGVLVGTLFGLFNGIAIVVFGVNSLVTTLATGSIALGIAQWWTGGRIFSQNIPPEFTQVGNLSFGPIPAVAIIAFAIAFGLWLVLERTPLGRYLYAVGSNPKTASVIGIRVGRLTVLAMVTAGSLAGLAGVLAAAIYGSGNPTIGGGYLLPAFSAVFLGSTIMFIGKYNVIGTVVAVFLLAVILAGLTQFGLPFYIAPLVTGVALLIAVAVTLGRQNKRAEG